MENFGEAPWQLCLHPPFPKQLQLIADRQQAQPCAAAAPSQEGCWVWASKRGGVWTLVSCPTAQHKARAEPMLRVPQQLRQISEHCL